MRPTTALRRAALKWGNDTQGEPPMKIPALLISLALGCSAAVFAADHTRDSAPSNSSAKASAHQLATDVKGAMHKLGAMTKHALHRADATLHRNAHRDKDA
jgi:hypothetical protein